MIRKKCENCGRPLLQSDLKCFHCGTPVPGVEALEDKPAEGKQDLAAAKRFGGVVLGLLVVGTLLMSWMGAGYGTPLTAIPTVAPPAGWREFVPPEMDFQIWLPNYWELATPSSSNWEAVVGQLAHPLPNAFRRIEPTQAIDRLKLIARSPGREDEVPLALSVDLHPGLVHQNLAVMQADLWVARGTVIDTSEAISIVLRPSGDPALLAELVYRVSGEGYLLHSLTMLTKTSLGMYAITVSAQESDFLQVEEILWSILDSFQSLDVLRSIDV